MVHGPRRAAEMEEAAKMVRTLGLPAHMAQATAASQRQVAPSNCAIIRLRHLPVIVGNVRPSSSRY
jgi:Domain of unknown function (DUF1932)